MADNENTPGFILHGNRQLIAGLHWKLIEGRRKSAARRVARENGNDYFTAVTASKTELLVGSINLASEAISRKEIRGAASLALCLLPRLGSDGWAIFRLADGLYWFIAAQNSQLSLFSDVAGSKDEVQQALQTYLDFGSSVDTNRVIICPEGFMPDISGCETSLDILKKELSIPRAALLHPVSNNRALVSWSALLVIVFGGYFGWQHYLSMQEDKRAEAARTAFLKAREQIQSAMPSVLLPWKNLPAVSDFVASCSHQWKPAPLSIAGWRFTSAECTQQLIRFAWSKPPGGTIGDFTKRLAHWYPGQTPLFNIPGSADTGGVSLLLQMPLPQAAEAVGDMEQQTQRLTNYAQQLRARLTLTEEGAQQQVVNGQAIPLPWRTFSFRFDTDIPPDRLFNAHHFDASGLRLTRIAVSLNNARLHYSLEGKLYAKR